MKGRTASAHPETGGEVWMNLLRILSVRLALLSALLASARWLMPEDSVVFHAFIALAFVVTIPYALWIRNNVRLGDFAHLQFLVDLVVVTGLVYFTGGVTSGFVLLYPLVILAAGIITSPLRAFQITILCLLAYLTLGALMNGRVLVPYQDPGPGVGNPYVAMAFHAAVFSLFGLASVILAQRLTYLHAEARDILRLRSAAQVASAIAHEVRSPLSAISGCVQLLEKLERRTLHGDVRSKEILSTERAKLHRCIVDESDRLDCILEKFINHAEFSEEKLEQLVNLRDEDLAPRAADPEVELTPAR